MAAPQRGLIAIESGTHLRAIPGRTSTRRQRMRLKNCCTGADNTPGTVKLPLSPRQRRGICSVGLYHRQRECSDAGRHRVAVYRDSMPSSLGAACFENDSAANFAFAGGASEFGR